MIEDAEWEEMNDPIDITIPRDTIHWDGETPIIVPTDPYFYRIFIKHHGHAERIRERDMTKSLVREVTNKLLNPLIKEIEFPEIISIGQDEYMVRMHKRYGTQTLGEIGVPLSEAKVIRKKEVFRQLRRKKVNQWPEYN